MKRSKIKPDITTYTSVLACYCKLGDIEQIKSVIRQLKRNKVSLRAHLISDTLDKAGKFKSDFGAMEQMFDLMKKNRFPLDTKTNFIMLTHSKKTGNIKKTEELFQEMKSNNLHDSRAYNIMISLYQNRIKQIKKKKEMKSNNLHDTKMYNRKISMYQEKIKQLAKEMKSNNLHDSTAYNTLIDLYGRNGDFNKMEQEFNDMKRHTSPNIITYNCMINHYGDIYKMEHLQEEMKSSNTIPNDKTYHIMIEVYAKNGGVEKVEQLIQEMQRMGIMSVDGYNCIINIYSKWQDLNKMEQFFDEMKRKNFTPSVTTYSLMLNHYADNNNIMKIKLALEEMDRNYCHRSDLPRKTQVMLEDQMDRSDNP